MILNCRRVQGYPDIVDTPQLEALSPSKNPETHHTTEESWKYPLVYRVPSPKLDIKILVCLGYRDKGYNQQDFGLCVIQGVVLQRVGGLFLITFGSRDISLWKAWASNHRS